MSRQRDPELRHIVVIRHAKSSWDDPSVADHDRPLSKRGRNALPRLLDHIEGLELRPDLVKCSSSRRTRETLDGIRPALGRKTRVESESAAVRRERRAVGHRTATPRRSGHHRGPHRTQPRGCRLGGSSGRRSGNRRARDRRVPDRRSRGPVGGRAMERAAAGLCLTRELLDSTTAAHGTARRSRPLTRSPRQVLRLTVRSGPLALAGHLPSCIP